MADNSSVFIELLGDKVLSHDSGEISTASLASKSGVMIYFSAHWCPPCKKFTPELATYYKTYKESFNFEIIFASSDKDSEAWKQYWSEMPWLALPYENRKLKDALSKKYGVSGIPTLVVLDNQGNTITTKARGKVSEDPSGYPWTPKTFYDIFKGEVQNAAGNKITLESLKDKNTVVGIYFSAHWCPPCKKFTPELAKTYDLLKAKGTNFEIIFASSDKSETEYKAYFSQMPWLALPFKDPRADQFSDLYDQESLPSLIIVDTSTGKVVNDDGRMAVVADPQGNEFPWVPKPANPVDTAAKFLNSTVCFLYLDSNLNNDQKTFLTNAATNFQNKPNTGKDLKFYYGSSGGIIDQIRTFASLDYDPVTVIFNIPDNQMCVIPGQVTNEAAFCETVDKFVQGKLTPQAIK